ncbi:hypothetical protein [Chryseolinea lacunae]|uniref:Uncharacterized protein n=1 Tax=Chryseolinea lacunae TaxID=2801331 RepID=A0ABS1L0Z4_9BACT|nr:hypothetical protein [Chryseolinea lacunae]MBL0745368.1 hypothetical protein [Chryseolinea lacunae]
MNEMVIRFKTKAQDFLTSPLEVGQSMHAGGYRFNNAEGKTINHGFRMCIAKMANLSQYCTSFPTGNTRKKAT